MKNKSLLKLLAKNMGLAFFLPLVVVFIYFPLRNIQQYLRELEFFNQLAGLQDGRGEMLFELRRYFVYLSLAFLPFFSSWWSLFVLRESSESSGKEILRIGHEAPLWWEQFYFFLLYLFLISIPSVAGIFLLGWGMIFDYIRLIMICVYLYGIALFLLVLSQSIGLSFIMLFSFVAINNADLVESGTFPFYMFNFPMLETLGDVIPYLAHGGTGLILVVFSYLLSNTFAARKFST